MSRPIASGDWKVDHQDGATGGEEADDCGGMRQPVADHEADGRVVRDTGLTKGRGYGVGVRGDVVAGIPAASNSMHGCSP